MSTACLSKAVTPKAKLPLALGLTYIVAKSVLFCRSCQWEYEAAAIGMNIS